MVGLGVKKILIVEDHPILAKCLVDGLVRRGNDISVVYATTLMCALALVKEQIDLDAVILDLGIPGADGISALTSILQCRPRPYPVAVVSARVDSCVMREALAAGAAAFISKQQNPNEIFESLELVLRHGFCFPVEVAAHPYGDLDSLGLTGKELDVLGRLVQAKSNKMIAYELALSLPTTKFHVSNIYRKLNVKSRAAAMEKIRPYTHQLIAWTASEAFARPVAQGIRA